MHLSWHCLNHSSSVWFARKWPKAKAIIQSKRLLVFGLPLQSLKFLTKQLAIDFALKIGLSPFFIAILFCFSQLWRIQLHFLFITVINHLLVSWGQEIKKECHSPQNSPKILAKYAHNKKKNRWEWPPSCFPAFMKGQFWSYLPLISLHYLFDFISQ